VYLARADYKSSYKLSKEFLNLADSSDDTAFLVQAHYVLGATLFCIGEINQALEHIKKAYRIYNPQMHSSDAFLYGLDPGCSCLFWLSWMLWYLGYPDQALSKANDSIKLSQELSQPYNIAAALNNVSFIHQFRGEVEKTLTQLDTVASMPSEGGFGFITQMGAILYGWALGHENNHEKGIKIILKGIEDFQNSGAELFLPYWLGLLAENYMKAGINDKALTVIEEAQQLANKNNERYYEAEIYRLKGELLLELYGENNSEPEKCFLKSIEITRKQNAKSLELRAVTSYSRLLLKQGKKAKKIRQRNMLHRLSTYLKSWARFTSLKRQGRY